ncbi:hypothetical protein EQO05_14785 [Methanosarcina sp. MSH10X1]|uniref:hypothetical protein n=1 Tax=Methanosarcina sp. MSH10X1 TaxID=2507075 RepID=UPI000FFC5252|nr:hypothetical protein [Methanosarcina sp. MSH10X1]RXA15586.1 hypothetical protein EQO05_14785 [Methanosarcina sp. MSH10X1]
MDKKDIKESMWDHLKSIWASLPEAIKLIATLLSIAIAVKALFPATVVGINNFDASPEIIEPGGASVLSWGVSGADNITLEPGIGPVSSNGSLSVSPSETTTYKLTATGKGKEKVAVCTVTVNKDSQEPLIISSFDASPDSINPGESAILNWHVAGVSNVTIEPDIGVTEPTGTLNVSPASTTTYKLIASNGDKEDAIYCTVAVEENTATSGNVSQSELPLAEESLTPEKEEAVQENPIPEESTAPPENSNSQENSAPQESQAPREKLPSIGSFNAIPDTIGQGESSSLTWSVSGASKVSIEPEIGTVGLTGSQHIFPGETTTYTLTATNEFGSVDATKIVSVKEASAPAAQEPVSAPSPELISTPEQLSPADGTVFDNSTSGITLEWRAVPGAANYAVEIDQYDSGSGLWLSESAGSGIESGITTTSYSFEPPLKTPFRWRVWAVSSEGQESEKSGWWNFDYAAESSLA